MKALISSEEAVFNFDGTNGYRVAEIHETGFEVAAALFWVDCADDVVADQFYYDPVDSTIKAVPVRPRAIGGEPNVIAD